MAPKPKRPTRRSADATAEGESSAPSLGAIKSPEQFQKSFPNIAIAAQEGLFRLTNWNQDNRSHCKKIITWLEANAGNWLDVFKVVPNVTNEATLYP